MEDKKFTNSVRIVRSWREENTRANPSRMTATPSRSRLYGIEPIALGTVWQESLTSYLNRLGGRHHVSPRALAAQEFVPHLSNDYLHRQFGTVSRTTATGINGNGEFAR